MKKTILKRILALTIVFLMIISTPFYISENINNNPYVYAAATFTQSLESELFKQALIPTLISAGLVFSSKESIEKAAEDTIEWLKQQGFDFKPPDEPDGPNLEDVIKEMLKAVTLVSASYELGKGLVEIPKMLWDLIKSFVDDNYNEGLNKPDGNINGEYLLQYGVMNGYNYTVVYKKPTLRETYIRIYVNGEENGITGLSASEETYVNHFKLNNISKISSSKIELSYEYQFKRILPDGSIVFSPETINTTSRTVTQTNHGQHEGLPIYDIEIIGKTGIVDNPNYDWNNNYTDSKVIPIPIEKDVYGNFKTDENGYYLPSIDTEEWIDVQPEEIPNLDPSGTPNPDIPPFPDIENPDDDEKTGIMIYIGNVLQTIVGQLSKIVDGVKTTVSNTNKLVFNTPNPVFDPITGEQIDPETGEVIVPEYASGQIGNGIDVNIPKDFKWGNFRHFLDIFFIFIYFIVILILIILKFLQIVFVGIPNIAANTDLFTQYPNILEGVDYVKNLQVGGLTITVHQAFEFVFLIFFYIFIIKQIRKLYNAYVFEQPAENPRIAQDMKMDYYENIKNK
ncbi:MAG: hypothetical protein GX638_06960 [Crenarchaeota archaeon]|nr:hypothetical protein [Thermoproteota archaeon]